MRVGNQRVGNRPKFAAHGRSWSPSQKLGKGGDRRSNVVPHERPHYCANFSVERETLSLSAYEIDALKKILFGDPTKN